MTRNFVLFATFLLAAACSSEPPAQQQATTTPKPRPQTTPNPSLPKKVEPVALSCGPKGTKVEYHAQTQASPPTVDVSFRGRRPTSQAAEAALRKCLQEVADSKFVSAEVMGTVWHSTSGSEDDDEAVTLPDGSDHLVFRPETKKIITWKQREGGPEDVVTENVTGGYLVRSETNKILVAPFGTFVTLHVVFKKEPTEKQAFEVLIAEVRKAVSQQPKPVATTAYANVGPRDNPAAQRQVKGSNGQFIHVEFDPKRPNVLATSAATDVPLSTR